MFVSDLELSLRARPTVTAFLHLPQCTTRLFRPPNSPSRTDQNVGPPIFTVLEPTTQQLPTPNEVRAQAALQQPAQNWPPDPVIFSDLNLLVKYGGLASEHEYHCLQMIRTHFGDEVPVPEVYGCYRDGDEVFIYMELIHGRTLEQRWDQLSENDRMDLCSQLRSMVAALREVKQASGEEFIGSITGGELLDRIFEGRQVGPFASTSRLNDFLTQIDWSQPPMQPPEDAYEMRSSLPDDPITFTHSDLHRSNIMITPEGETPRILAIIDWQQSGWYPGYWESCKARWTVDPDDDWVSKYLPKIIEPHSEAYDAWNYICLCHGE